MSRLNNRKTGQVIVIAHRVHEDDLSGHLLRQGKWRHVVLPMVALSDASYDTDYGSWRRRKGDLLRPDAFDAEDIEHLQTQAHNPDFDMLYQQNADDRALPPITEDCLPTFAAPLGGDHALIMSIDPGMTPGPRSSFSVIQIWCRAGHKHYLLDQWREQCDYEELKHQFLRFFRRYRPSAILIEAAANGHALISEMQRKHQRLVHEISPKGSKTARLRRHVESILGQRIILPEHAPCRGDFVFELVQFPHVDCMDQVDAMTQYLDWISGQPILEPLPRSGVGAVVGSMGQRMNGTQPGLCFSYAGSGERGMAVLCTSVRR